MSILQAFIITMGLAGQILIARKDHRGYAAWIAGNLGLMIVYHQTHQPALIGLQIVNTTFQVGTLIAWRRSTERLSRPRHQGKIRDLITPIAYRPSNLLFGELLPAE
jgi:nicotinamide riboside transporter PnuC